MKETTGRLEVLHHQKLYITKQKAKEPQGSGNGLCITVLPLLHTCSAWVKRTSRLIRILSVSHLRSEWKRV